MMFPEGSFRGVTNKIRTKSLFYELCYKDPTYALFTLKENDLEALNGKTYLSLHKLFVSMVPNDPTEYEFALTVFGSWDVWSRIRKSPELVREYKKWRAEADIKIKSQAIKSIAEEMVSNGRSSFSAAKLLLDRGWLEKDTASKAKEKLDAKEQEEEDRLALRQIGDDASRLGLKLN
jgi:hypothetical protein